MVFIVAFGLLFALPVSDAAPALSPPALSPPAPMPAEPCSVRIVGRDTLRVGEHPVYMQPLVVDRDSRGEILFAGRYTHVFEQNHEGAWFPMEQDSVFGVVLSAGRTGRVVPSPIPAHRVYDVRARARSAGGWDVVFTELPDSARDGYQLAVRLWHGVLKGTEWTSIRQIPLPAGHRVNTDAHGELVRTAEGLAWAVHVKPENRPSTVMVFRQEGERWTYDPLPVRSAAYAALAAPDSNRLVLALVRPDPALRRDGNSLFLWVRDPEWRMVRKVVPSSREEVHRPMLHMSDELILGWEGVSRDPLLGGRRLVRVLPNPLPDEGREPITVDSANLGTNPPRPVLEDSRRRLWVTMHSGEVSGPELRFVKSSADGASVIGRMPYPFDTPTLGVVAVSPSEMLVAGGDYDPELRMIWMLVLAAREECGSGTG